MDLRTFGTYGGGVSLMTLAWQNLTYELEIKSTKFISDTDKVPRGRVLITNMRCEHRIFEKHPVDNLAIDNGTRKAPHGPQTSEHWELILDKTTPLNQPKIIVEVWPSRAVTWDSGPAAKGSEVRWIHRGYETRIKHVDAQHMGGALIQPRTMVVRLRKQYAAK